MLRRDVSLSRLFLSAALVAPLMLSVACGDDDSGTSSTTTGSGGTTSMGGNGGTGGDGGSGGDGGGTGGMGGDGGMGGGGGISAPNQFANAGFEMTEAGGPNGPYDPPSSWLSFSGFPPDYFFDPYESFATQAHDQLIYDPVAMAESSTPFPGYMDSRALKFWGPNIFNMNNEAEAASIGFVYQEWDGVVPSGSNLVIRGRAYVSSIDPMGTDSNAYLIIKCFGGNGDFSNYCEDTKSTIIDSTTAEDTWIEYSVTVESLNPAAGLIQAGVEFEQCSSAPCSGTAAAGAVFWDELYFAWE